MIIKHSNYYLYSPPNSLTDSFRETHLFKPKYSRITNTEFYIVLLGYKEYRERVTDTVTDSMRDGLQVVKDFIMSPVSRCLTIEQLKQDYKYPPIYTQILTPGDGFCTYHALFFGLVKPSDFVNYIKEKHSLEYRESSELRSECEGWGGDALIDLYSRITKTKVIVLRPDASILRTYGEYPNTRYITYHNSHYSATLPRCRRCLRTVVLPTFTVSMDTYLGCDFSILSRCCYTTEAPFALVLRTSNLNNIIHGDRNWAIVHRISAVYTFTCTTNSEFLSTSTSSTLNLECSEEGAVINAEQVSRYIKNVLYKHRISRQTTLIFEYPAGVDMTLPFKLSDLSDYNVAYNQRGVVAPLSLPIFQLPEMDSRAYIINSMREIATIWKETAGKTSSYLQKFFDGAENYRDLRFKFIDTSVGIYDVRQREFIRKPSYNLDEVGYAFDGKTFVRIPKNYFSSKNPVNDPTSAPYLVFAKSTKVMIDKYLFDVVADRELEKYNINFTVKHILGVPGSGKTHFIVSNHDHSPNLDTLVLTATKESATEIYDRVISKFGSEYTPTDYDVLKRKYKTMDSVMMSIQHYLGAVKNLYIDEGLMRHVGQIFWLAYLLKVDTVYICGDSNQIPYFNSDGIFTRFSQYPKQYHTDVTHLTLSRRIPVDAACFLHSSDLYEKISTTNRTLRSLRTEIISGSAAITRYVERSTVILTFTQAEKYQLTKELSGKTPIFTVGEFQGRESDSIILVRLNDKNVKIYTNLNQQVVALSRHKRDFIYLTTIKDDLFKKIIENNEMDNTHLNRYSEPLLGGAYIYNSAYSNHNALFPRIIRLRQLPAYSVEYRPPTAVNLNFESNLLGDLVLNHDYSGATAGKPIMLEDAYSYFYSPDYLSTPPPYNYNCLVTIQDQLDTTFPGASIQGSRYDDTIFESDSLEVNADQFTFDKEFYVGPTHDTLTSSIRSHCPPRFRPGIKMMLKAFNERNGGVPELEGRTNPDLVIPKMVSRFEDAYIAPRYRNLYENFREDSITINVDSLTEWLSTQPPNTVNILRTSSEFSIYFRFLDRYDYILKNVAKPSLDPNPHEKFTAPQTIVYQHKQINAVFCPVVKELKSRLIAVLRTDKIINSDSSVEDLEAILNQRLPAARLQSYTRRLECDFSKYDKSQGILALYFETELMRRFGISEDLISLWIYMHVTSRVRAPNSSFTAHIEYQRRSGDAMTYLGNTLFLMGVLSYVQPMRRTFAMFSGDDSYVFTNENVSENDITEMCASVFNLEIKLLDFKHPYFCSKFLIFAERWYVIPDPVKIAVKLGRSDICNFEHAAQYRMALIDNTQNFSNYNSYDSILEALVDRYSSRFSHNFLTALYYLPRDEKQYAELFYTHSNDVLRTPSILPNLD